MRARWAIAIIGVAVICAAVLLWRYTPLVQWADADRVAQGMTALRDSAWAPLIVIALFVLGGLTVFPLTLLITATAIVFEPSVAVVISIAGALANALTLYAVGRWLIGGTMRSAFGAQIDRLTGALDRSGIIAVAAIRMVPIAPYSLVNLAAGSIGVRLRDYTIGTFLGVLPGTIALTAFGHQLREIIERPTVLNVALLLAIVGGWIALSLLLQQWVARHGRNGAR